MGAGASIEDRAAVGAAGVEGHRHKEEPVEGPEITTATAVLDNGPFGTREIRFETGRLARQAAGSCVAYLDEDTMLLSATTAGKHPKEHFDFFPLTVDGRSGCTPRAASPVRSSAGGSPGRGRDPHLPADRPAAAPQPSSKACATRYRSS